MSDFVVDGCLSESVKADVQGFTTSGYGHLRSVAYVLVHISDAFLACQWLKELVSDITSAVSWRPKSGEPKEKPDTAINIAFTHSGLAALGLAEQSLCSFPPAFREGMAEPARAAHVLGDTDTNGPEHWEFGGPNTPSVDACVILHANIEERLESLLSRHLDIVRQTNGGISILPGGEQRGYRPENSKEHFGFRDGIAQPEIVGIKRQPGPDVLPTGNLILGYPDHYGMIASGPVAQSEEDSRGNLPVLMNPFYRDRGLRDLGRNGTYVVYRKIEQHVSAFWQFMQREAELMRAATGIGDAVAVAAKLVGRWPSGAPLVLSPERDDSQMGGRDDFAYAVEDPEGRRCPFGAHIRRSNPRNMIRPNEQEQSLNLSRAHRIRRHGSIYGPQMDLSFLTGGRDPVPAELTEDGLGRGVHFLAVNANIERQFELIQQQWINNPAFNGVSGNQDPIAGARSDRTAEEGRMSIPKERGVWLTQPLPRFVTVRGGAYFFLPGLRALRFLAALR